MDRELWKSDGTEAGTVLVKDIKPGSVGSTLGNLTNVNGALFQGVLVSQLRWQRGEGSKLEYLANVDGTLYMFAYEPTHGYELWRSDGTEAGTELLNDINPGPRSSYPGPFTEMNGKVFFGAIGAVSGKELWALAVPVCGDGTTESHEECDDGNALDMDGCSAMCRLEDLVEFWGLGQGGAVELVVEGVTVSVDTSPGDTPEVVAAALVAAINTDPALFALAISAQSDGRAIWVTGEISSVVITDPGLTDLLPPIPTLSLPGLVLFSLLMAALCASRRRGA